MVREFYSNQGGAEKTGQKEIRSEIERLFRLDDSEREVPESAEKLENDLQDFDFAWLLDWLKTMSKRIPDQKKFKDEVKGVNGIIWNEEEGFIGSYNLIKNVISLNPKRIENKVDWAVEDGLDEELSRKLILARALIHEYIHVYSMNRCYGLEVVSEDKTGTLVTETGLETSQHDVTSGQLTDKEVDFEYANEGLVDLLSEGIFLNYLDEIGVDIDAQDQFNQFYETMDPYHQQREFMLDLIEKITEDSGIPFQVAFEGFIHQLQAGGKLDNEVQKWFVELVGVELFDRMKGRNKTNV
ncbi:MAG: hypothetical protein V1695_00795 [Candidatus Uhrbacteria bacterium]